MARAPRQPGRRVECHGGQPTSWSTGSVFMTASATRLPGADTSSIRLAVTHGHAPPQPVAQVALEGVVPPPGTTPMPAPRRRHDPAWPGLGGSRGPAVRPPGRHRPDGTRWPLRRGSHRDGPHRARPLVDPREPRTSARGAGEVMPVAREGALTPWLASVLAIPTPGFLRRVHSDARIASRRQRGLRRCHGVAWRLTVRMVWPGGGLLDVDPQRVVRRFQPAADGRRAGRLPRWRPPVTQLAPTPADPRPRAHRVTRRCRRDTVPAGSCQQPVWCAARGRPAPGTRPRSVGRSVRATASSCRPRLSVGGSSPVMGATHGSPPWPRRVASRAASHRRCCSSRRDRHTCLC